MSVPIRNAILALGEGNLSSVFRRRPHSVGVRIEPFADQGMRENSSHMAAAITRKDTEMNDLRHLLSMRHKQLLDESSLYVDHGGNHSKSGISNVLFQDSSCLSSNALGYGSQLNFCTSSSNNTHTMHRNVKLQEYNTSEELPELDKEHCEKTGNSANKQKSHVKLKKLPRVDMKEQKIRTSEQRQHLKQLVFFEDNFQANITVFCNYLQACLHSKLISHALNVLELRISSVTSSHSRFQHSKVALNLEVFEIVLKHLAAEPPKATISCNFLPDNKQAIPLDVVRKLFGIMHNLKIKPSPTAYAAALEALSKIPDQHVVLAMCLQQIENDGYSLKDVVQSCNRGSKNYQAVLRSIRYVTETEKDLKEPSYNYKSSAELPSLVSDLYNGKKREPGALHLSSPPDIKQKYTEQLELEKKRFLQVKSILSVGEDSKEIKLKKQQLSEVLGDWRKSLLTTFQNLTKREKAKHNSKKRSWKGNLYPGAGGKVYPFLCLLPESEYIEIIINHLCRTVNGGDFTSAVSRQLGEEVFARFVINQMKETGDISRLNRVYEEYVTLFTNKHAESKILPRHLWEKLEQKHGLTNLGSVIPWNSYWILMIGMKLIEIMNTVTFMPRCYLNCRSMVKTRSSKKRVPAIFNTYAVRGRKQFGMTIPHPEFQALLRDASEKLIFESEVAPMVVPPKPWCKVRKGGFLVNQSEFIRSKYNMDEDEEGDLALSIDDNKIAPIFDSLNILASVAWVINKPILDLQIKYFRNNGNEELDIPRPASCGPEIQSLSNRYERDAEEYWRLRGKVYEAQKTRKEMHSLFMDGLYKLSVANMYRDEVFWFVHNIDFRGRCYPVARHFNYMGSDVYRALFLFSEGRKLGENGLDWLKIHCINLTDFKKHDSIADRLTFANEVMDEIIASADDPDRDDAWWKKSDKPWQTLATCMEIAAAVRSPNPAEFVSRLPVHQDGSCNGLQHYAALGRDEVGAQQVNLSPSTVPQDVYLGVAAKAEELRKISAEEGHPVARALDGFVRRKVVKQTVMTTVYGVTRYGGMHQIRRQLVYLKDEFPEMGFSKAANYLVDLVFKSITEMFTGARNIQNWLTQLADVISKMGHAVEWTTPLNLPVTQPYYKQMSKHISSSVQRLVMIENNVNLPNPLKQKNGFPPNFVHSLDSTHMMLTSLHCCKSGITFSSVHDCYWTHACSVDIMNAICRDQFISLHSRPILDELSNHLKKFLPCDRDIHEWSKQELRLKRLLDDVPQQGEFNLNKVKDSTYFFS